MRDIKPSEMNQLKSLPSMCKVGIQKWLRGLNCLLSSCELHIWLLVLWRQCYVTISEAATSNRKYSMVNAVFLLWSLLPLELFPFVFFNPTCLKFTKTLQSKFPSRFSRETVVYHNFTSLLETLLITICTLRRLYAGITPPLHPGH